MIYRHLISLIARRLIDPFVILAYGSMSLAEDDRAGKYHREVGPAFAWSDANMQCPQHLFQDCNSLNGNP